MGRLFSVDQMAQVFHTTELMQLLRLRNLLKLGLIATTAWSLGACTFRKKVPTETTAANQTTQQTTGANSTQPRLIPQNLKDLITTTNADEFTKEEIDPLIQKVQDIDLADGDGTTLLELCVRFNQYRVAQRLLAMGANPFSKNHLLKKSVVQIAQDLNRSEMIKLLQSEQEKVAQVWLAKADALSFSEINKQIISEKIPLTLDFDGDSFEYTQSLLLKAIHKSNSNSEVVQILSWTAKLAEDKSDKILFAALLQSSPEKQKFFINELPRAHVLSLLKTGLADQEIENLFVLKVNLLEFIIEKYKVKYETPGANQIVRIGDSPAAMAERYMHRVFLYRWSNISPDHEAITRRHLMNLVKIFDPERRMSRPGEVIRIRPVGPIDEPIDPLIERACKIGSEECFRNEVYYLALIRVVQPNLANALEATQKTLEILQLTRHPKSPVRMTGLIANPFFKTEQNDKLFWRSRNDLFQVTFSPQIQFTNFTAKTRLQVHDLQLNPALIMQIAFSELDPADKVNQLLAKNFILESNQPALAFTWTIMTPLSELSQKIKPDVIEKYCSIIEPSKEGSLEKRSNVVCSLPLTFTFADIASRENLERSFVVLLNTKPTEKELTIEMLLNVLFEKNQVQQIKANAIKSLAPYLDF